MRIPFDIKHRDKIESGEYKVETRDGRPVRVICWNAKMNHPIVALTMDKKGDETYFGTSTDGYYWSNMEGSNYDLFIVTPESEFERAIIKYRPQSDSQETIQRIAAELLALAKEECKSQIESDFREIIHNAYEKGKNDVLKDLPRWRIWKNGACGNSDGHPIALVYGAGRISFVSCLGANGEKYIILDDLKKLPGFNDVYHE